MPYIMNHELSIMYIVCTYVHMYIYIYHMFFPRNVHVQPTFCCCLLFFFCMFHGRCPGDGVIPAGSRTKSRRHCPASWSQGNACSAAGAGGVHKWGHHKSSILMGFPFCSINFGYPHFQETSISVSQ